MDDITIQIEGVSVRYSLAKEEPRTFMEFFIRRLKGRPVVFEDFWALRDVSFSVPRGETLGIIGHNGAGKSTLLKVIAGVIRPTAGRVAISGTIAPLIELGAGFDIDLTGTENIYLNASLLGLSRREIDRRFPRILEFSELEGFIHSPLRSYSSGMVARLGFSIATEVDPDVLIIDEILEVGDEHFSKKCVRRIEEFRGRGVTMLFVSHTLPDIERLCDRVLWLDHGNVRLCGEPARVVDEYRQLIA